MFKNNKAETEVWARGKASNTTSSFLFKSSSRHSSKRHPVSWEINKSSLGLGQECYLRSAALRRKAQGCPNDTGMGLSRKTHLRQSLVQTCHCQGAEQPHRPCLALAANNPLSLVTALNNTGDTFPRLKEKQESFTKKTELWRLGLLRIFNSTSIWPGFPFHAGSISPGAHVQACPLLLPRHAEQPPPAPAGLWGRSCCCVREPRTEPKHPHGIKVRWTYD